MSVDALHRPARRQEGRRGVPARTMSEQSQLDDILQDLLADPMFLNNSRSYEWANDAEGTYGSISPQQGSITTHSGHGGRTVVSWQMNQTGPKDASVAVTRRTVDRPSPNSYVESETSRRLETTASARPASADRTGSRYESRRVETRTEATTRRDGMTSTSSMSSSSSKPQPPSPPIRRRLFNPETFNHDSPVRTAPVPPPRREVPPPETASRTPMHFQSAPSTPSTPHRNYVASDTEDGPSRWLDEQRGKLVQSSSSSRQQKVYRTGPAAVVQSDTEDYFRPSAPERRGTPRSQMESPSRWATNAYDDPNFSDSGISPRRLYGSQSAVHSRSADTRAYDLESGRLFETKKSFFVSGIERPADRSTQTKYTFSVSPQRSLTGDEFPTSPSRISRPPPRPITPSRTCTSPVLPPLRTDSSREAVMRVNASRDFVSPKPTRDVHSPTLDELEKSLQDFHSLLQAPPAPKPAPSPTIDELVVANKSKFEESAMPPEEEEEEEVISLQPIGPGVQYLEPDEPLRQRSVTPGFPGFSSEAVTPVTPPFPATQRKPYTNTNQGFSSSSNITTPTTPNLAATTPVNDVSRYIEEFATLTETNTLQRAPPAAPQNHQPFSNMDEQATLTRQSVAANQNAPPSAVGNTADSEMHIYQTPRRQYSQPQTISEQRQQTLTYQQQPQQQQQQQGLNFQQGITTNQQQTPSAQQQQQQQQQYQYQINEQSQHGFAVPYQYDQQQQQTQVTSANVQKSQPVAVIEQVNHQQQFQQAYTQRGTQPTGNTSPGDNPAGFGNVAAGGGATSSTTSVQYRTTSSASGGGGQGMSMVDGQWNQVHGQPVTVQDGSRTVQQFGVQQQSSSTMSGKRSGMVLDTAVAGSATTPRALSPATLPAPSAAARNRSISPSDMTLRARLQSRLESRSPGMAMMAGAGGQTSPSVYFGTSRTGSLSSLNDGEVLLQSPRFVRDTSKLWHKPHITREEAITLLKDKPPGSFVVRNSNTFQGAFGLALKVAQIPPNVQIKEGVDPQSELVRHFLIEPTSKGVRLKGCTNEPVFGSLAALVYQHTITPLALPCKLLLPDFDIAGADATDSTLTGTANKSLLYVQGAACNVLYINSIDMESLTGPEALSRAIAATFPSNGPPPYATDVHFKVSSEGITLTDNKHRLFFRRHYPINTVTFCGVDARDRRWTLKFDDSQTMDCKVFGFVARKPGSNTDNACHVFAEMDPNQPANAIVNFLTKVMIGQGHFMKT